MPTDARDLERRLAVCTADDRVRGMMINELLALVQKKLGPAGRLEAAKVLPPGVKHRDLLTYPIADFVKLMFHAADLLESTYGSTTDAIRACGAATVEAFSRTPAGRIFFGVVSLAGPPKLLGGADVGYRSVVTYGRREYQPLSDTSGRLVVTGDMQPPAYHEGVLQAVLGVVGYDATVTSTAKSVTASDYVISWRKRAS